MDRTVLETPDDARCRCRPPRGGPRLGLLAGLTRLGWNKALDIVEHPDPAVRERERVALPSWLHQAEQALETGLV